MGVVHGEEDDVGERLAHREGRRRLAGREGLEKFFWLEEEETNGSSSSCGETKDLTFRTIALLRLQPNCTLRYLTFGQQFHLMSSSS